MQYALEINDVTKVYPQFTLDHVTLRVNSGTIMGLIGENGAGKTTTLRLLLGLAKPNSGSITLMGETNPLRMQQVKRDVGVVLDEGFFPEIYKPTHIDKVCKGIYDNWDSSTFGSWLARLKLPSDKIIKEFSKGMKMKLAIAVALSHQPRLLILDEATGGLDPVVRSEILDVFLDFMQDDSHAILFSTHITTDLERIADAITFLHGGRVVMQDDKDTILERYGVLKCGQEAFATLPADICGGYRQNAYGYEVLIKDRAGYSRTHPDAVIDPATLDEIMLLTIRGKNI